MYVLLFSPFESHIWDLLGKCPLTYDGVFGLSDEYEVTNVPCGTISIVRFLPSLMFGRV